MVYASLMDTDTWVDGDGNTWAVLPEDAHWDRTEGAFIVDGTPVMVITGEPYYYMIED